MSTTESDAEDATTKDEIEGSAPVPPAAAAGVSQGTKRNACESIPGTPRPGLGGISINQLSIPKLHPELTTSPHQVTELMSPKRKVPAASQSTTTTTPGSGTGTGTGSVGSFYNRGPLTKTFKARDGLGAYVADPASFPASRVVFHDASFVAINDLYPKASVHTLLLPRDAALRRLHPFDALGNPGNAAFLAAVREQAARLRRLVAKELQRRYGRFSRADAAREAVLDGGGAPAGEGGEAGKLPRGRDWEAEVRVGVHARPSMNDLHVHALSRDMFSECLRHRKHYNSFNTPFFVDLADLPLAPDDPRRHPGRAGYLDADLTCWRCGRNFGNRFKQLKEHLAHEFEEWKKE
ncbi:hypothetical protein DL766_000926 [Monosporascus sp. MC13-8B]|uniref:Aprataxin C2HE/C2H2/C2HC zinc finger domain-containing protein n=1 Tax=Monosporascus cannonballus TaxID=155416 RepID=A0ABY0HB08_9PEZI|nr:hypothetical protein DL762_003312 [Monosporascus cannonballus]RYP00745.1 hypothetical protein DL763_000625 [Monosporascus cannonballus]RYP38509.1 hypothetical protein DL766_000926 [Monosporascus sp. MC13-8B]